MPGEFYIEGKKQKVDVAEILAGVAELEGKLDDAAFGLAALKALIDALEAKGDTVKAQTDKLAGESPVTGSTTANWNAAEADVVSIGTHDTKYKVHSLLLSIHNLIGSVITVRLYKRVNGVERKVYEQSFNAATDPPGLWVINGTLGIHEALRVTLQSNDATDNGKSVDYDCMLEAMS